MSFLKVSSLAIAATLFAGSAFAADLIVADPVVDMASPKAYDAYLGIIGTAGTDPNGSFGGLGVVIGADVDLTDVVFIGAEVRGTAYFGNGGYTGFELLGLGRLGFHASDSVDLYLTGGAAHFEAVNAANSSNYYTVGLGAEFDVTEEWALRAEVTGSGAFGAGVDTYQATVGALWKF
jgi:opacity protein-like surface antigen